MTREQFPASVDFQTANTRPEFQGGILSCTTFGVTSALEAMADRAGQPVQLSPRWLWYYIDKARLSVETVVATVNRMGLCKDALCPYVADLVPPYTVHDITEPPSLAALMDAQDTAIKISVERIAGKDGIMRTLATGHAVVSIRTNPSGTEHCEAIIGYDADGFKVHGSGFEIYWAPWDSLPVMTQLYKLSGPWAPVPDPDYVEGDLPTFADGVLTLPLVDVATPYPEPWLHFANVALAFDDYGVVDANSGDIAWQAAPVWNPSRALLAIPVLIYAGKRYLRVSLTNPRARVLSHEIAT